VAGFWDANAADWGTAVGTVGLALITTVSVLREARDRRELRAERDAARHQAMVADRRAAELQAAAALRNRAEAVSCRIGLDRYDPAVIRYVGAGVVPSDGNVLECALVQNLGDRPIRNVVICWAVRGSSQPSDAGRDEQAIGVVPAMGARGSTRPDHLAAHDRNDLAIRVRFDDVNGVRWQIGDDGSLAEIPRATSRLS
jgi:hypothetical protein